MILFGSMAEPSTNGKLANVFDFIHAKVAQRRQSVLPVPVGLSNNASAAYKQKYTKIKYCLVKYLHPRGNK
jgi:hypothetical protein